MKRNKITGLLFILFGLMYLTLQILGQLGIVLFSIWDFWPLITITLGFMFEAFYYSNKRSYGFLIPGGILTTIGLLHLFETITGWLYSGYTWPIYILAVFIGFFHVYLVKKDTWALVVSIIFLFCFLLTVTIVLGVSLGSTGTEIAFASIIIIVGLLLLLSSKQNHS